MTNTKVGTYKVKRHNEGAFSLRLEAKDVERTPMRSSFKECKGNALASGAEERRDKLR